MAGPLATRKDGAPGLDAREARRLDLNCEELGVPVERLMANAGKAVAREVVRALHGRKADVLVLCGKGNNGGDGFAAAAELQAKGIPARVVLAEPASRIAGHAARLQFARLAKGTWTLWKGKPDPAWAKGLVYVDCLLGSGLDGAPRKPYDAMVRWLDARKKGGRTVISCDVPSGIGSALAVRPTTTVALHQAHPSLGRANAGRITVASIGIPARAADIGFGDAVLGYPMPDPGSHKGDNGIVLVVAGSDALLGAPHYVALGAQRAGADLVHIAAPLPAAATGVLRSWDPGAIVHSVGPGHLTREAMPAIEGLLRRAKALVIGPGLGTHPSTLAACREVLAAAAELGTPTVVDADGLDAVDDGWLARHGARTVLTPHGREFQDLTGKAPTRGNVESYALSHGVTILRKGATDVVSDGRTTRQCSRGHPTMTVGGTGDVLAGIVGALLAKGATPLDAACAASYLSKAAGEVAASVRSFGASATDVADAVPSILARVEAARQAKA